MKNKTVLALVSLVALILISFSMAWLYDTSHGEFGDSILSPLFPPSPETVLPANVAGTFYPGTEKELRKRVGDFMKAAQPRGLHDIRALVVPHAGYLYSGKTAAAAYRELDSSFKTVFLLADNHNANAMFRGAALPDKSFFAIPGVTVPVHPLVGELAKKHPSIFLRVPAAFKTHILEVHLPFLNLAKGWKSHADFAIVPIILSSLSDGQMDELASVLHGYQGSETIFIASTDLSHFLTDAQAREIDRTTLEAIVAQKPESLQPQQACGRQSVQTVLALSQKNGWNSNFIAYDNSSITSGDFSRVVGYGAAAFTAKFELKNEEKKAILNLARETVTQYTESKKKLPIEEDFLKRHPIFKQKWGVFVTIKKQGHLRGCVGFLNARDTIANSVRDCAISACSQDNRFPPVAREELAELSYTVSLLTPPKRLDAAPEDFPKKIVPHKDGVILVIGKRSSTFLPEVWEQIPVPENFLQQLCLKQGSSPDAWKSDGAELYTYSAYAIHE